MNTYQDKKWSGLNLREEGELEAGEYTIGENVRCTGGVPQTRKGLLKPFWAHRVPASAVTAYETPYGFGVFRDPNIATGRNWLMVACAAGIFKVAANNGPRVVPLPTGVALVGKVTFTQAFNKLYLWRGRDFPTLVLSDLETGFEDRLPHWDPAVDYALGDRVLWGPWLTPAALAVTSSGDTMTVVQVAHGYVTGQDVRVKGAVQTEYNGRRGITVVDRDTFTMKFAGSGTSPATGTILVSNMTATWKATGNPAVADEPGVDVDWTQIYDVLPNADSALFINNRMLVPTALTPATVTGYTSAYSYTKRDFIVATDFGDTVQFDWSNEFRINQGDAWEIQDLLKFSENTALVFKEGAWGVLSNVGYDLTGLKLDMRETGYGLTSRGAVALAGEDVIFLAGKRGVVSVGLSTSGKFEGRDVPLSWEVEKWLEEVDWALARTTARVAYWNNKAYVAVPQGGGRRYGPEMAPRGVYSNGTGASIFQVSVITLQPGRYRYVKGNSLELSNDALLTFPPTPPIGTPRGTIVDTEGEFVVEVASTWYTWGLTNGATCTASIRQVRARGNTCLLVYDFLQKKWAGRDTGLDVSVLEFALFPYQGVDRLFFLSPEGYVNLVEELDCGCDQVDDSANADGLGWEVIALDWRSRFYAARLDATGQPRVGALALATWHPQYSVEVVFAGVNKVTACVSDRTRDRTKYNRPWDAADYVASNVNDDHAAPERQDYSVDISGSGVLLGSNGVGLDLWQETLERLRVAGRMGRRYAVRVQTAMGRVKVLGCGLEEMDGRGRMGSNG